MLKSQGIFSWSWQSFLISENLMNNDKPRKNKGQKKIMAQRGKAGFSAILLIGAKKWSI
jgi:hypothetical protein